MARPSVKLARDAFFGNAVMIKYTKVCGQKGHASLAEAELYSFWYNYFPS